MITRQHKTRMAARLLANGRAFLDGWISKAEFESEQTRIESELRREQLTLEASTDNGHARPRLTLRG